ncbi:MAG: right-handed parallel beta-helix repeat-containing protein, partial [Candidatus Thermoplasmatota archaeon]
MNRKIFYLFIFGFALLFIIMLLPKSEAACSGIAPPGYAYGVWPKGSTWIIDAKTECSGETIYAMGDVSIKANGELVLNSSKLIFVLESDGQYKLEVEAQGKLTVKNSVITSFSIVKDLQVLVTLDTKTLIDQGKMRADGGDIRFTDEFGNQLNYWIEPQYVRLFPNSGFETGGLANWTEEVCCAWSIRGPGDTNAGRGHEGNYQADSLRRSGEAAVGTIRSETFKIVGDYITFLIGGWSSINVVQLVNASDGAVLLSTSAPNCDCWRAVSWDVKAYRGREVYIRAIDANPGGSAAWFSIDDFKQIITVYSNETRIWVKTNPVKGRVNKIYLNYGKSDATSLSSAKDTFIPDNIFLRTGGWRGEYAGAYAYSHRDFDNVLNNFNKTFNIGIGRIGYVERVDHGFMGWDWYYPDHFFHQYKFLFVPSSTKNYLFGTDGDDGVELIWNDGDKDIRHETIASWFGGHGTCWCWNPSYWNGRPLAMGQGVWFEFRQQEWGGGEYARMGVNPNYEGWRTMHKSNFPNQIFARKYFPSDPAYTVKAEVTGSTLTGWGYNKPIEIDLTGRQYDYSTPQAREENYYYKFIVKKDGIMDIEGSDISGTWGIVGPDQTTDVYGGIQIYSSFVTIKNSKIHDSKVMGIYVNGVSIMMENLDVYNNGRGVETTHIHKSVPYHGIWWVGMSYSSGIYLVSSAPSIESSYIHDNFYWKYSADYGGYYWVGTWHRIYGTGIYMVNSNPYIGNSTIKYNGHDNESTEQNYGDCGWGKCLKAERGTGSGIYGYRSSPTVYNCTIMRNFVGIYINEHKPQEMEKTFPVIIENCYIAENWDARDHHWRIYRGIGIFFESVWLGTILNNTIEYNGRPYTEARGWYDMYWAQGFGILFRSSKTDILSNIIRYNWRGIFFWESSMGRIAYNQIVWNTVRPHEPPWWWWWSFPWWYYWTWHWKFHGIGIWLETSCNPIIEYNEISHNGDKYTAQFMHNYWETCDESYGIRAHGGSNPIIRYNNITWNGYFGVRSYDSSSP